MIIVLNLLKKMELRIYTVLKIQKLIKLNVEKTEIFKINFCFFKF